MDGKKHVKAHYRVVNGKVTYIQDYDANVHMDHPQASLADRSALGTHKDKGTFIRATDMEDRKTIEAHAAKVGAKITEVRRAGANHFGRQGAYDHLHFESPEDAAKVYGSMMNEHPTAAPAYKTDDLPEADPDAEKKQASAEAVEASDKAFKGEWNAKNDLYKMAAHHMSAHHAHAFAASAWGEEHPQGKAHAGFAQKHKDEAAKLTKQIDEQVEKEAKSEPMSLDEQIEHAKGQIDTLAKQALADPGKAPQALDEIMNWSATLSMLHKKGNVWHHLNQWAAAYKVDDDDTLDELQPYIVQSSIVPESVRQMVEKFHTEDDSKQPIVKGTKVAKNPTKVKDLETVFSVENTSPGHSKTYATSIISDTDGKYHVMASWGKIDGKHLSTQHKGTFGSYNEAEAHADKLIKQKKAKGYLFHGAHSPHEAAGLKAMEAHLAHGAQPEERDTTPKPSPEPEPAPAPVGPSKEQIYNQIMTNYKPSEMSHSKAAQGAMEHLVQSHNPNQDATGQAAHRMASDTLGAKVRHEDNQWVSGMKGKVQDVYGDPSEPLHAINEDQHNFKQAAQHLKHAAMAAAAKGMVHAKALASAAKYADAVASDPHGDAAKKLRDEALNHAAAYTEGSSKGKELYHGFQALNHGAALRRLITHWKEELPDMSKPVQKALPEPIAAPPQLSPKELLVNVYDKARPFNLLVPRDGHRKEFKKAVDDARAAGCPEHEIRRHARLAAPTKEAVLLAMLEG